MTNYNKRQDEALALIKYSVEYRETHGGCPPEVSAIKRHGVAEAKQALTSLMKELVAEAKPKEMDSFYEKPIVDQFEQNLLKELEDK